MLKKLIGVVAVTTMALVASASATGAQDYPPGTVSVRSVNNPTNTYSPGDTATFEGECFLPGSTVTLLLNGEVLGSGVANDAGVVTITVTIPTDTPPGPATVTVTGTSCDGEALSASRITILGTQAVPPGEPLPRTGSNPLPVAQIAVAAIVAGGFLLIMANRRRAAVVPVTTQRSTKV